MVPSWLSVAVRHFVLGLCEKRSSGRRSSRASWVRPRSGLTQEATILDLWSVQANSLPVVSVEVECLGVEYGCDRLTAGWFSCVGVSWIRRVFRWTSLAFPQQDKVFHVCKPKLVMMRLDIYQVLPREVTTARTSIDSFTGARRFVHRDTNVSRVSPSSTFTSARMCTSILYCQTARTCA